MTRWLWLALALAGCAHRLPDVAEGPVEETERLDVKLPELLESLRPAARFPIKLSRGYPPETAAGTSRASIAWVGGCMWRTATV